jgi:hypothetical protein
MSSDALFVAEWIIPESSYKLSDAIPAFEIVSCPDGTERCGPVCGLPPGTELEACGQGFNERTLQVRCGDRRYFAFLQDLYLHRRA